MTETISILQANVARRREAQLSILNDTSTQDFELIMITEPNIIDIEGKAVVNQHAQWTVHPPLLGTTQSFIHTGPSSMSTRKHNSDKSASNRQILQRDSYRLLHKGSLPSRYTSQGTQMRRLSPIGLIKAGIRHICSYILSLAAPDFNSSTFLLAHRH